MIDAEKANVFAKALNDELSNQLATKSDLIQLENRMIEMENKIIKWMVGLILASTAINITVTGFLVTL